MNCPQCDSDNVEETDKFDLTVIYNNVCHHDFECFDCKCLFQIEFHPVQATIIENQFGTGI